MSLINDMLHNVDVRASSNGSAAAEVPSEGLLPHARLNVVQPVFVGFVIFCFIIVLISGIKQGIIWSQDMSHESSLQTGVLTVVPAVNQASPTIETLLVERNVIPNDSGEIQYSEIESNVDQFLVLANQALMADRLTTPVTKSAYLYYHQVLLVQPQNVVALKGLEKITERYIIMARKALSLSSSKQARHWLEKALEVTPNSSIARIMLNNFNSDITQQRKVNADVVLQLDVPFDGEVHSGLESSETRMAQTEKSKIVQTKKSQDESIVNTARRLIANGENRQAEELLYAHINRASEVSSMAPQVHQMLFSLVLAQGRRIDAEKLISLRLPSTLQAYLKAKLAVFDNRLELAMTELKKEQKNADNDELYRAFMAGIYQQLGQYSEAEKQYRRLLSDFGSNAHYWLGLGLSLDQQKSFSLAAMAYERIPSATGVTQIMINFSRKRIAEL